MSAATPPERSNIEKTILIIQPLAISSGEVLQQAQGMSIISMILKNDTETFDYSDQSLGGSLEIKGTNITIEDMQCDITKSLAKALNKNTERTDLVNLLQAKGEKLLDVEIIHGVRYFVLRQSKNRQQCPQYSSQESA
eukprot:TRINITY_DN105246_c4_g1_i1.p5 TRINITY_DN105246_c4_g1~~TRINITY_DN105246_c4_g1_i1.p5  ORF type:complete len:138 (-),score=10.78 TRINITY_DN105246_c4_g1_i1:796-1209(-)